MEGLENIINNSLGLAAGLILGAYIIALAIVVFSIICNWKIFVKMGAPGWASIIPFYCNWVLCDCVWENALVSLAIIIPGVLGAFVEGTFATLLSLITMVVMTVTTWKKYKKFGKSTGFCILGLFLPMVTEAICAFGSAEFANEIEE